MCPVFGRCGGCQYQDIPYEAELALKTEALRKALAAIPGISDAQFLPVKPSPQVYHYRNRLDLKMLQRRDGTIYTGFSPVQRGPVVEIDGCPIAMKAISDFIPQLRTDAIAKLPKKYRMASLVVRCGDGSQVRWGGIGRKSTRLLEEEYLFTDLLGKRIFYSLDTFFQANLAILPSLAGVLRDLDVWDSRAVFYDLYGGVGLMGLLVADLVARVVNIEENVHAIRLARYNMMHNKIANMEILPGRIEHVLPQVMAQAAAANNILMIDPPRAGLSAAALKFMNGMDHARHLLYLSCSPESLARDLMALRAGWDIQTIHPFDFFPRTRHIETLVVLSRSNR